MECEGNGMCRNQNMQEMQKMERTEIGICKKCKKLNVQKYNLQDTFVNQIEIMSAGPNKHAGISKKELNIKGVQLNLESFHQN